MIGFIPVTGDHWHLNCYVRKQPVAWKKICGLTDKKAPWESIDRYTGLRYITRCKITYSQSTITGSTSDNFTLSKFV